MPSTPVSASYPFSPSVAASTSAIPSDLRRARIGDGAEEAESLRTESGAAGHDCSHGSSVFSAPQLLHLASPRAGSSGDDSDGTKIAAGSSDDGLGATVCLSTLTRGSSRRSYSNSHTNSNSSGGAWMMQGRGMRSSQG